MNPGLVQTRSVSNEAQIRVLYFSNSQLNINIANVLANAESNALVQYQSRPMVDPATQTPFLWNRPPVYRTNTPQITPNNVNTMNAKYSRANTTTFRTRESILDWSASTRSLCLHPHYIHHVSPHTNTFQRQRRGLQWLPHC